MKHSGTRTLFHYWNDLRGGRPAPTRSEFDPAAVPHQLADILLMERNGVLRLAGTRACELFGRELRGVSFVDLWEAGSRAEMADLIETIEAERAAVVAGATGIGTGEEHDGLELLMLPLQGDGAQMLGLLSSAALPDRVWLYGLTALRLGTVRLSWPDRRDESPYRPTHDQAEVPVLMHGLARRHGRFFVYEGGQV